MHDRLDRLAPLAGVPFAVLTIAGDLVIGPFPDTGDPLSRLRPFYADHHAQVYAGGILFALAAIPFVVFAAAVWARIRRSSLPPLVAAVALAGGAVEAVAQLTGANAYVTLGGLGAQSGISPGALQAWHVLGSEGVLGNYVGTAIFLLAAAYAGIAARALPRVLAWTALALAVLVLTPVAFVASLAFVAWTAVAGIVLVLPAHAGASLPATASQIQTG